MRMTAATAILVLGACDVEEGGGPERAQAETIDAARLLTSEEVGGALGAPVGPPERQLEKTRLTQAGWSTADGRRFVSLMARTGIGDGWGGDEVRKTIRESGAPVEEVKGLGRDAFWSEGMLHVLDERGNAFILTISPAGEAKSKAVELMRKALGRIGDHDR